MNFPIDLTQKINYLYSSLETKNLKKTRENLTEKYKTCFGKSLDLIENKEESILYAISRMPATFSVSQSLISDLSNQGLISDISSAIDLGSGTGSGYFALKSIFPNIKIELFERNKNMISVFNYLSNNEIEVRNLDIVKNEIESSGDLVLASYFLSELNDADMKNVLQKLFNSAKKYLLIVDTGTPETYKKMLEIKDICLNKGFYLVAPCMNSICPLNNDYCQFFTRVERSSLMRISKSALLPYEDEKFFYLLFSKLPYTTSGERVIRRPKIQENFVELMLCTSSGVKNEKITKKDKEKFKRAKKIKVNQKF